MNDAEAKTAYTIKETAQQLGIPVATVRRLVASNQLASTLDPNGKFGPTRMIAATAIEAYRKGELPPVESLHEHNKDCAPLWVLDAETAEVERLTKELEQAQFELKATKQENGQLQSRLHNTEGSLRKFQRKHDLLRNELRTLDGRSTAESEERAKVSRMDIAFLQGQLQSVRELLARSQAENKGHDATIQAQADHINTLKNTCDMLARQITDTNDAIGQFKDLLSSPANRADFLAGLRKLVGTESAQ